MKPTTDIEQVKSVARALLMTEVNKTPYSPDSGHSTHSPRPALWQQRRTE